MNNIFDFVEDIKNNKTLRHEFLYALRNLSSLEELQVWFTQKNIHFMIEECGRLFQEIRTINLMKR